MSYHDYFFRAGDRARVGVVAGFLISLLTVFNFDPYFSPIMTISSEPAAEPESEPEPESDPESESESEPESEPEPGLTPFDSAMTIQKVSS